ncbi:MAG: 2-oxoglutarate dehydrogenase E1 component [Alphaproteobacteria bacterium]|nr:2-oxoglutarate dehydrogenase E1 component [Alphaproteobacteria bacterium]
MSNNPDFSQSTPFAVQNAVFIEELYERYMQDPASVDSSWRDFFRDMTAGSASGKRGASWAAVRPKVIGAVEQDAGDRGKGADKKLPSTKHQAPSTEQIEQFAHDSIRAIMMVRAYRVRGHLIANLDPLGIEVNDYHPELDYATYGFTDADLDREIFLDGSLGIQKATLRQILTILRQTYCGNIGVEFMHIMDPEQKAWIQKRIEGDRGAHMTADEKKKIWNTMVEVESFEQFLQVKYPSTKRFSVQGGDVMLAGLEEIINTSVSRGVKEIIIGMPHRGRMNVLTTTLGKPYAEMFSLFHGNIDFPEWVTSSGDVKYHLGTSSDRETPHGKVHLSLLANPSHLEAVNPVVVGKVRAKLDIRGDVEEKKSVLGVMLHGDAAFAGQGSVPEVLSLSELRGYRTGGSIHIIVNNQIGFTTSPKYSRFTPYPTDVAKMVQAPIFHANADDPESVAYVCRLAAEFRQEFGRDTVVDIICYRKYGHNESDEPMFTQPIMYREIAKKPLPAKLYSDKLVAEGTLSQEEVDAKFAEFKSFFDKQYEVAKTFKPNKADWLEGEWAGLAKADGEHPDGETGVDVKILKEVGLALAKHPGGIKANSKILRQLDAKKKMMEEGKGIDWATGEALAYGTLLKENHSIRLSGQDCGRGTFSQRHSVLVDQDTEERYIPLNNLGGKQANYEVIDSSLSEFAILGFEYGYSLARPNSLTLWEAQFGDFANGAQVIVDQFISSAEVKWLRMSGLVMLLPHGYEGQGPEHSSARLERYLQSCAEDNMIVANCTTPANYFHILRRQLKRNFRKPLIIMTPKSLLRHKLATSTLADMGKGTHFKRIIGETETLAKDDKIQRVVVCSGKVYYDLFEARAAEKIDNVAIIRMEQYYPFPSNALKKELARYKNAEIIWCQEEPRNMGAWSFVGEHIEAVMESLGNKNRLRYVGRPAAASPACGYLKIHEKEQKFLVLEALTLEKAAKLKKAL